MSWLVILIGLAGCAGGSFSLSDFANRFGREKEEGLARYGPAPDERVAELRSLAERADQLTATQQQAISERLVGRLRDETDPILRCELVRTISMLAAPGAVAGLHVAMEDPQKQVRIAACQGWQRLGGAEAVRALITALERDADVDVRLAAAKALGAFEAPEAIHSLVGVLDSPDPAVQRRAMLSLKQATGEDFGGDRRQWQQLASRRWRPDAEVPTAEPPHGGSFRR